MELPDQLQRLEEKVTESKTSLQDLIKEVQKISVTLGVIAGSQGINTVMQVAEVAPTSQPPMAHYQNQSQMAFSCPNDKHPEFCKTDVERLKWLTGKTQTQK